MPESPSSPKPQRRTLYLLLVLFFTPLAASFVLYYGVDWRPAGGTNHGELITPPRQLPAVAAELEGKWALVHVGEGSCSEACRHSLHIARQTHVLLNKDMDRIDRVLLATSDCCDRASIEADYAGIRYVNATDPATRDAVLQALPSSGDYAHDLFVVDPLRNVVLRFDTRENPKGLLEDLKKMFKLSHIG
jgi:hypothetical protein